MVYIWAGQGWNCIFWVSTEFIGYGTFRVSICFTMESVTVPYTSSADAVKEGVGTNSGRSPPTQLLWIHSPLLSPLPKLPF